MSANFRPDNWVLWVLVGLLAVLVASCGSETPPPVEVIVEKEVIKEVVKEVEVPAEVVEVPGEVIVKEVVKIVEVPVEVIVEKETLMEDPGDVQVLEAAEDEVFVEKEVGGEEVVVLPEVIVELECDSPDLLSMAEHDFNIRFRPDKIARIFDIQEASRDNNELRCAALVALENGDWYQMDYVRRWYGGHAPDDVFVMKGCKVATPTPILEPTATPTPTPHPTLTPTPTPTPRPTATATPEPAATATLEPLSARGTSRL